MENKQTYVFLNGCTGLGEVVAPFEPTPDFSLLVTFSSPDALLLFKFETEVEKCLEDAIRGSVLCGVDDLGELVLDAPGVCAVVELVLEAVDVVEC